jgi:hypothetical protein
VCSLSCAAALAALPLFAQQSRSTQQPQRRPQGQAAPAAQRPAAEVKDNLLTYSVRQQPLERVLDEISQRTKIAVIRLEGVGSQRVSFQFNQYPVEEALRQILADYDAFYYYGVEGGGAAALRAVWVYPKGRGVGLAPVPPEEWASTEEMQDQLEHSNPDARIRAINAITARRGDAAQAEVLKALEDPDARVRAEALYAASANGVELPPGTLHNLLADPAPDVRFLALDALANANDPGLRNLAQAALYDSSPAVQARAREIIEMLEAADRPPPQRPTTLPGHKPGVKR